MSDMMTQLLMVYCHAYALNIHHFTSLNMAMYYVVCKFYYFLFRYIYNCLDEFCCGHAVIFFFVLLCYIFSFVNYKYLIL